MYGKTGGQGRGNAGNGKAPGSMDSHGDRPAASSANAGGRGRGPDAVALADTAGRGAAGLIATSVETPGCAIDPDDRS
jgi:hypothetical protein